MRALKWAMCRNLHMPTTTWLGPERQYPPVHFRDWDEAFVSQQLVGGLVGVWSRFLGACHCNLSLMLPFLAAEKTLTLRSLSLRWCKKRRCDACWYLGMRGGLFNICTTNRTCSMEGRNSLKYVDYFAKRITSYNIRYRPDWITDCHGIRRLYSCQV